MKICPTCKNMYMLKSSRIVNKIQEIGYLCVSCKLFEVWIKITRNPLTDKGEFGMKRIFLVISKKLKPIEADDDMCFYGFDESSFDEICSALDLIQDKEAKKHYKESLEG